MAIKKAKFNINISTCFGGHSCCSNPFANYIFFNTSLFMNNNFMPMTMPMPMFNFFSWGNVFCQGFNIGTTNSTGISTRTDDTSPFSKLDASFWAKSFNEYKNYNNYFCMDTFTPTTTFPSTNILPPLSVTKTETDDSASSSSSPTNSEATSPPVSKSPTPVGRNRETGVPMLKTRNWTGKGSLLVDVPEGMNFTSYNLNFIKHLRPEMQDKIVKLFKYAQDQGIEVKIDNAFRTYQQQVETKRKRGSWAATPGKSLHEFGLAVDIMTDRWGEKAETYSQILGEEAVRLGLGWGGYFRTKRERWHFELKFKDEA